MNKYKVGDKVLHFGEEGTIKEVHRGKYFVDFGEDNSLLNDYIYESELSGLNELEDDRGKNRMLDDS